MKQQDIALIIVIAAISATISFVASDLIFVTPANRQQKVEVVDVITTSFQLPNAKYFNSNSVDPTLNTALGGNNTNPFGG